MLGERSKPHSFPSPTIDGLHHLEPAKVYTSHQHKVTLAVLKFQGHSGIHPQTLG